MVALRPRAGERRKGGRVGAGRAAQVCGVRGAPRLGAGAAASAGSGAGPGGRGGSARKAGGGGGGEPEGWKPAAAAAVSKAAAERGQFSVVFANVGVVCKVSPARR